MNNAGCESCYEQGLEDGAWGLSTCLESGEEM